MLSEQFLNRLTQIMGFGVSLSETRASGDVIEEGTVGWPPDVVVGYMLDESHQKGASEGVT